MPYTNSSPNPTMADLSEFITTEEASKRLNFHIQSIRHLMRAGKLEGVKVGRTWLVSKKSIEEYQAEIEASGKHNPKRK